MTHSKVYIRHQILFLFLVSLIFCLPLNYFELFSNFHVYLALILFFGLGIPHGALDLSLGKKLLQPKFGSCWCTIFVLAYMLFAGFIVIFWLLYPLPSFLFFIAISAFHFGLSDRLNTKGWIGTFEAFGRGFLPIVLPAYFYPHLFQELVKSSLSDAHAATLITIIRVFFYPNLFFLTVVILYGFFQKTKSSLMNSLELVSLLALFLNRQPFTAFLIYFCFLHSLRHILCVLEEMNLPFNRDSVKWLILQALPATIFTLLVLAACYLSLEREALDVPTMLNLFFISLAALTFPHMILVEAIHE